MAPIAASIVEAARAIGVGRTTLYELISSGELPVVKIGRRTLIPLTSINALIARRCPSVGTPDPSS